MTAIIGMKFGNGILITADRRITNRATSRYNDDSKKIIVLNQNLILAYAGIKNIIDAGIEHLKDYATASNTLEDIVIKSKTQFGAALDLFKKSHPNELYSTVYILAGINDEGEPFIKYFSSDDRFQITYPLKVFYKTYPEEEMEQLGRFMEKGIDYSKSEIEYYVKSLSSAIRDMESEQVGNTTYSIYLSRDGIYEIESDENGEIQITQL